MKMLWIVTSVVTIAAAILMEESVTGWGLLFLMCLSYLLDRMNDAPLMDDQD
jgi:hypothetical protein